jgi:hypothetical protein
MSDESQDRIQRAWDEIDRARREGREPDFDRIPGLTDDENMQAWYVSAAALETQLAERLRQAHFTDFLQRHAPEARSVATALAMLTPEQMIELHTMLRGMLEAER